MEKYEYIATIEGMDNGLPGRALSVKVVSSRAMSYMEVIDIVAANIATPDKTQLVYHVGALNDLRVIDADMCRTGS